MATIVASNVPERFDPKEMQFMIKGNNFIIGHILISDLPALVPLLNDPDIRGAQKELQRYCRQ